MARIGDILLFQALQEKENVPPRYRWKGTLTDSVRAWHEYLPEFLPLPHPSPRNTRWLAVNPWFEQEVIPALRQRVSALPERFSEIA